MAANPAPRAIRPWLAPRQDRLIRQPTFDVLSQGKSRLVSLGRLRRHRPPADSVQGPRHPWLNLPRSRESSLPDSLDHILDRALERSLIRQKDVERGPETVDVAGRPHCVEVACGLLGAHEGRCSHGLEGPCHERIARLAPRARFLVRAPVRDDARSGFGLAHWRGHSPIHHERLAERAQT